MQDVNSLIPVFVLNTECSWTLSRDYESWGPLMLVGLVSELFDQRRKARCKLSSIVIVIYKKQNWIQINPDIIYGIRLWCAIASIFLLSKLSLNTVLLGILQNELIVMAMAHPSEGSHVWGDWPTWPPCGFPLELDHSIEVINQPNKMIVLSPTLTYILNKQIIFG